MPSKRLEPHPAGRRPGLRALAIAALLWTACSAEPPQDGSSQPAVVDPAAAKAGWRRLPPPSDLPSDRPLHAGFLIVDGVFNTELVAPYDVFDHTDYQSERPPIEVFTVSPDGGPITTYEGLVIDADYGFDDAPPIDVLVVPSAENSRGSDLENRAMIDWVRITGEHARFVMSLCWGAFVLAEAGLLDGGACTTFPSDFDRFAETFPQLELDRTASFVHDGKALTSQGGVKSFEAAMYLVDHLYGEEVARAIGGGLLIDWPPPVGSVEALVVEPRLP